MREPYTKWRTRRRVDSDGWVTFYDLNLGFRVIERGHCTMCTVFASKGTWKDCQCSCGLCYEGRRDGLKVRVVVLE